MATIDVFLPKGKLAQCYDTTDIFYLLELCAVFRSHASPDGLM